MIYATSDLHYGISSIGDGAVRSLARAVTQKGNPHDILLIVGDVATNDDTLQACLALFHDFPGVKAAVAGNHDVWVEDGGDSWERFKRTADIFASAGFHPLELEPLTVGKIGLVGTMGWYDYSFRDDIGLPLSAYEAKQDAAMGVAWADRTRVRWPLRDAEVTGLLADKLDQHLRSLTGVDRIIAVTHHVPTKKLLFHPRCLVPRKWRYLNAFLGSEHFGHLLSRDQRVEHAICGHIHSHQSVTLRGARFTSIGSDYGKKALLALDGRHIEKEHF